MQDWKKKIFIQAIKIRVENMEGTAEEIVDKYIKLTDTEKEEILSCTIGGAYDR